MTPTIFYWLKKLSLKVISSKQFLKDSGKNYETVILVRYVPLQNIFKLIALKRQANNIILMLDDNLLDLNICSELPLLYKLKLFLKIYCYQFLFKFFITEIWVTSKKLGYKVQKKILNNNIKIKLLDLSYPQPQSNKIIYKIAYLGTSSHTLELKWLKPLFEKIQSERNDCLIEIYVDNKWRKFFRDIPRLKMIHPMDWETFYIDTLKRKVDIVVNPIISSKFNSFRSPTKFFDITRLGAVGLYSDLEPFNKFINNNHDGILLKNNIEDWTKKIIYLIDNKKERERLFSNALKRLANN